MIKPTFIILLASIALLSGCGNGTLKKSREFTYCNPLDLDYGWGKFKQTISRTSADPVIVLFKDKYYLFATHDIGGYRVSDDLAHWKNVFFNKEVHSEALNYGSYVAPAVAADENYLYFIKLNRDRTQKTTKILRSADPENGQWEVCGEIPRVSDPTLFIDRGHYFVFHGLGTNQSIKCFELDPKTMTMIPGSEKLLMDYITDVNQCDGGYHFGRREIYDEIDAGDWKGRFKWLPCPEGSWIVHNGDRYYLQFATPGTISIWYCDAVMESNRPDGGFITMPYNPVSMKVGGFIGSSGHSCVFKDKYGNWWEVTTMWVGNRDPFERRLGLFPVTFDEQGRMQVHTLFGDYPMRIPQRKFDPRTESNLTGWWNLSFGKRCTASSSSAGYPADNASDENVRTWWAAASGGKGEWLCMNLDGKKQVRAIQINFAEHEIDTTAFHSDFSSYIISISDDGEKWETLIDKSDNRRTNPHEYIVLDRPVETSFIRIENIHAPMSGKFAIRDLRVFGQGNGPAPQQVETPSVVRDSEDERFAGIKWNRVKQADGYMVRFGYAPDFLNLTVQVKGNQTDSLQLHILTRKVGYYYRVDAYNENGYTEGIPTSSADLKTLE